MGTALSFCADILSFATDARCVPAFAGIICTAGWWLAGDEAAAVEGGAA